MFVTSLSRLALRDSEVAVGDQIPFAVGANEGRHHEPEHDLGRYEHAAFDLFKGAEKLGQLVWCDRISIFSGGTEGNVWVLTKCQQSLCTFKAVLHAPEFGAIRIDQQVQAFAICQFVGLGLRLRVARLNVGEWGG